MINALNTHEYNDSLYINTDFNKFTTNLIDRIKTGYSPSIQQKKAIAGLVAVKKTYNALEELIAIDDPDNSSKIQKLKDSLELEKNNNTIRTNALMDNMCIMYKGFRTSKEDCGGFVVPHSGGKDPYLVKKRGHFKVAVEIQSICNHGPVQQTYEIKVRSYFYTKFDGNVIRGSPNYPEYLEILKILKKNPDTKNNSELNKIIKKIANRELKEETLLDLQIIDKTTCTIKAFGTVFECSWKYSYSEKTYKSSKEPTKIHTVNINMNCEQYNALKAIMKTNAELIQRHIEANSEISNLIVE